MLVFAFSGLLAGLAGVLESARIGLGHVDIGLGQMFTAITAVVIGGTSLSGGRGGVLHSAIGVLILAVLANGMIFVGVFALSAEGGAGRRSFSRRFSSRRGICAAAFGS